LVTTARTSVLRPDPQAASSLRDGELEVAEVEDGGDELAGLGDVALSEADGLESALELLGAHGFVARAAAGGGAVVGAQVWVCGAVE
jgi:hypothetical protein